MQPKVLAASSPVPVHRAFRDYVFSILRISGHKACVAVMLMFFASLSEGIGIAIFLPALQAAGFDLANQGSPHRFVAVVMALLSRLGLGTRLPLATVVALLAFIVLIRTAFMRLQHVYVTETVYQFVTRMDLRVYETIVRANWASIMRRRSSEFINLLTTEHERLIEATHEFLLLVAGFLGTALYIGLALLISVKLTLLLAGFGVLLALGLSKKTKQVHAAAMQASLEMMKVSGEALEHLQNLKVVKTYAAQDRDLALFSRSINKVSARMIETQRHAATTSFWWEGGSLMMVIGILYFALIFNSSSPATTLLLIAICARLAPKISVLNTSVQAVVTNLPAHTRMEAAISDLSAEAEPTGSSNAQLALQRSLAFDKVSFSTQCP